MIHTGDYYRVKMYHPKYGYKYLGACITQDGKIYNVMELDHEGTNFETLEEVQEAIKCHAHWKSPYWEYIIYSFSVSEVETINGMDVKYLEKEKKKKENKEKTEGYFILSCDLDK